MSRLFVLLAALALPVAGLVWISNPADADRTSAVVCPCENCECPCGCCRGEACTCGDACECACGCCPCAKAVCACENCECPCGCCRGEACTCGDACECDCGCCPCAVKPATAACCGGGACPLR